MVTKKIHLKWGKWYATMSVPYSPCVLDHGQSVRLKKQGTVADWLDMSDIGAPSQGKGTKTIAYLVF